MTSDEAPAVDCLIVGGGPAGLTAAIYLARYRRSVALVDSNKSRASLIPKTHNYPGFSGGISGPALLKNLRKQAHAYGIGVKHGTVQSLIPKKDDTFHATTTDGPISAHRIILATGLVDKDLHLPRPFEAIKEGVLRYCPICDGYEATGKRICVIGSEEEAARKALFLRTYSRKVTLLSLDDGGSASSDLEDAGIRVVRSRPVDIKKIDSGIVFTFDNGASETFDVVYPVLGCSVRSELALDLGAKHNEVGCLETDHHQRTGVKGIYAIGDVVSDLHQIAVGAGHAAVAATHIHNSLPRNLF